MKVAIIGSGIAGLTAGTVLANAGHQVIVLEQFERAGGVTAPFNKDGYQWDLGQLIIEGLGADEPLGQILHDLGINHRITIQIEDRGYVFPDFEIKKPEEYQGFRWRIDYLKERFPNDSKGLERYWNDFLRFTGLLTLGRKLEQATGWQKTWLQIQFYAKLLPFLSRLNWSAQQFMDDYFESRELQCVFISILADFFTPPTQFPGLGVFALNPEAVYDKRMPKELAKDTEQLYHYNILGGISTLVDAMVEQIETKGGTIQYGSPVTSIVIEDGRATGVMVNGETITADAIIASGGAKETFFKLIGEESLPQEFSDKVRNQPLMDSIFMVHLGLDFDPSDHLHGVVTYFYGTYDIEGALAASRAGVYHEGKDGFVVHVPSLHSPFMAPEGHHVMTIYTVCPDTLKEGSWEELKGEFTEKLLEYAEKHIPDLRDHIVVQETLTPEDFRKRTHLDHHAFGGVAPIQNTPRVPHQTPIQNLWFIGAQSESGGGVNNVMPAAYKVAKSIAKTEGENYNSRLDTEET